LAGAGVAGAGVAGAGAAAGGVAGAAGSLAGGVAGAVEVAGGVAGAAGVVVVDVSPAGAVAGADPDRGQYVAASAMITMTAAMPIHIVIGERRSTGGELGSGLLKSFVMGVLL